MRKTILTILLVFCNFTIYSYVGVKANTIPDATISGGGTFCQFTGNEQVTFTGSNGDPPYTFTYTIDGGAEQTISTNANNNSVNLNFPTNDNGTFVIELISVADANADDNPSDDNPNDGVSGTVTFNITQAPNNNIGGTGSGTFNGQPVFAACDNTLTTFNFTNLSLTQNTINTNYTIDWGDGSPNFTGTSWTALTHDYDVGIYTITYTIEGSTGCDTTRNYIVFVGSNPAVGFGNPGNTDICNDQSLTFPITGTSNNTVGTIYEVIFNDGSPVQFFDQDNLPADITHTFLESSCGTTSSNGTTTFFNSYSATIIASNPCNVSSVNVVPIYVSEVPVAGFEFPEEPPCVNEQICIQDLSIGDTTNGSSNDCSTNPNIIWEITPSTFTISSGTLGNDFGLPDPDVWQSGSETLCVNFNQAGTYNITQTVANRCGVDVLTKTICIEPEISPTYTLDTNDGCAPLIVNATNTTDNSLGCKPFEYEWFVTYTPDFCGDTPETWSFVNGTDNLSENPSFNFETPGTYTIELVGTNFCTDGSSTQQVFVKKPPEITIDPLNFVCDSTIINPSAIVESCSNDPNSVTYDWQFPGGTPSSSTLENPGPIDYGSAGSYTFSLQVTNECGTSEIVSETITLGESPVITNNDLVQSICSGTTFDDIILSSSISETTYNWTAVATPGITGFTASGTTDVIPGTVVTTSESSTGTITYTVTPSTVNCTGDPVDFVITVNPAPLITEQPLSSEVCLNGTPETLSISTSSTDAQFQWYSNTINSNTGGTPIAGATNANYIPPTDTIGEIFYYCEVNFSTSGCSVVNSQVASVTVVSAPSITSQPLPTQEICVGSSISVPLSIEIQGGTGTVSYQWFSNTTNSNTGGSAIAGEINPNFTPPAFNVAGNYFYYVEVSYSGSACNDLISNVAEIIVFDDPVLNEQPTAPQELCENTIPQDLEIVASGGIGNYNYQWFSNTVDSNTGGTPIAGATNSTFNPPTGAAGTFFYYCEVTQDSSGCSATSSTFQVIINSAPSIENQPISNELCLGETTDDLFVSFLNGVGTPIYQWYSNTIDNNTTGTLIPGETSSTFSPPVDTVGILYYYCIISFSSGGCSEANSNTAEINVKETPLISDFNIAICSGDTFNIIPDSSNGDIVPATTTYTWDIPSVNPPGTVNGTSEQNTPQTSISQTLVNTTSSSSTVNYIVTPTDGICVGETFNVTVTVNPAISANETITQISCFGANDGAITTAISGGIPFTTGDPYLAVWNGPNGFTSNDFSINNLAPGDYTLTISDEGGCPFSETYTIVEPDEITITVDSFNTISCFGANDGEINVSVSGGTSVYQFNWTLDGNFFSSDEDMTNLSPGEFELVVTDDLNCTSQSQTFQITEPELLEVSFESQTNILCFGEATGTIDINITGGTPIEIATGVFDYDFSWIGPNGFISNQEDLTGLEAGNYTVTVTDNNNCVDTLDVILTQPDEIIISVASTQIECYNDNDASITITDISGGVAPYTIEWSNFGEGLSQTNLSPGTYIITVTDSTNCVVTESVVIDEPPIFTIDPVIVTQISCFGESDGSISLSFQGGQEPIDFEWLDDPNAGVDRNNLGPGTYTINITDGDDCTISETYTILEPAELIINGNVTNALDCDDSNSGGINLIVTGGTPPFEFSWSNGEVTEDLDNIPPGQYQVMVIDANDCNDTLTFNVTRPSDITLNVATNTEIDCDNFSVIQIFNAQTSGGVPPFTFEWSSGTVSGTNNEIMTTTQNGLVILTATDSLGCEEQYSFDVNMPNISEGDFELTSTSFQSFGFYSQLDPIQFTNTTEGDFESISWDFGDGNFSSLENPVHTYINPGTYAVI
jgi:PKD repeat protein